MKGEIVPSYRTLEGRVALPVGFPTGVAFHSLGFVSAASQFKVTQISNRENQDEDARVNTTNSCTVYTTIVSVASH